MSFMDELKQKITGVQGTGEAGVKGEEENNEKSHTYTGRSQGHACPCCGRYIFESEGAYEICPECGWEDDPVQQRDPDFAGGANRLSLTEARAQYFGQLTEEAKDEYLEELGMPEGTAAAEPDGCCAQCDDLQAKGVTEND